MNSGTDASAQVPNHILLTGLMAPVRPATQPPKEKKKNTTAIIPPNYAMNQINIAPAGKKPIFAVIDATIAEEASFRTMYKRNDYVKNARTLDIAMINRDNMYIRCFPYCDRMNHKYQNYNTACGRSIKLSVDLHVKKESDGTLNDYDVTNNLIITSFICSTKNELTKVPARPVTKQELKHLAKVNKDLVIAKLLRVDDPIITDWGKKYTLYYDINPLGSLWSCTEILDDCMHQLTCSFLFRCSAPPSPPAPVEVVTTESTTSDSVPTDTESLEYFSVYVDIQSKPFQITSSIKEAIIKQQLKAVGNSQLASNYKRHLMKSDGDDILSNNDLENAISPAENATELPFQHELFGFHALSNATASNLNKNIAGVVESSMFSSNNTNLMNLINKKYGAPGPMSMTRTYDSSDTESESGSLNKRQKAEIVPKFMPREMDNVKQLLDTLHACLNETGRPKNCGFNDMLVMLPGKSEYVIDSMSSNLDKMDKFAEVLNKFKPALRRFTTTLSDSIGDQSLEELAMNNFFLKFKSAYCDAVTDGLPTLSLFSLIAESMSNDAC